MYLHVCRHVCVRHTCTYALDTAPMSQNACRYSQIHADAGMCISNVQCVYQICIELYPVHMSVHMCAVCDSHTCTYINPYLCYMCFTYMHICTGRITDVQNIEDMIIIFYKTYFFFVLLIVLDFLSLHFFYISSSIILKA